MMKMPPATDFGGVTDIPKNITREIWRARMGNVDCIGCHQLGQIHAYDPGRAWRIQFGRGRMGASHRVRP
jgi:hypothetical protein